ncbi:P-type conjugative transfer ATPase TrbB [Salmonella enterica]|nr:P-type conjugative transfer ATPase TrbB [Salmonella enterica]EAR4440326.1 P-type conjugative transfer ATPase TrbB [Salmonella enterica]EAS0547725.1 P-type conjugative transfer ATPase TrbB [Salmonella enterica]ECP3588962.1 P-type conjugative transfer ATPase TrbB [Salmonella enterica]
MIYKLINSLVGDYLNNDNILEIYLNGDMGLWVDDLRNGRYLAKKITDSSLLNNFWDELKKYSSTDSEFIFEGELPGYNARIECLYQHLFCGVSPIIFAIRKHPTRIYTLQDYKDSGAFDIERSVIRSKDDVLSSTQSKGYRSPMNVISEFIRARKNILVVGGTGSGKTTLTNAILNEIAELTPDDRVITIEDTPELQLNVKNRLSLKTYLSVDMQILLRCCMRLHPTRILVGEVRGGESYSLLKAWNSGHAGGVATLHANSASEGLEKLAHYIFEDPVAMSFDQETVGWMISTSVDMVLVIERTSANKRRVKEICQVKGYSNGKYNLNVLMKQSLTGLYEFKPQL